MQITLETISNPSEAVRYFSGMSPNSLAFINSKMSLNYRELNIIVDSAGEFINKCNIFRGETVAQLFEDELLCLVFSIALVRFGYPQFILQPNYDPYSLTNALKEAGIVHIISDKETPPPPDVACHIAPPLSKLAARGEMVPLQQVACWPGESPILCFFGSGTTGKPRIICHSAAGLFGMVTRDISARPLAPRDRHLSLSRLNYFTALRRSFAVLSTFGVVVVLDGNVNCRRIIHFCNLFSVDHLSIVNIHAQNLIDTFQEKSLLLPDLKSLIIGSSPISEVTRERIVHLLTPNLFIGYGTNEFGEATILRYGKDVSSGVNSIGYPCYGVELRIANDSGAEMLHGDVGEIQLRSNCMFYGYKNKDRQNSDALSGRWFRTSDLGYMTEKGEVIFAGRSDDMMIYNGISIYPREIEAILEMHPLVTDVAALSIPSDKHGDVPIACVVSSNVREGKESLLQYAKHRLGTKAPQKIFFFSELPKNPAGKILKRRLRELFVGVRISSA
jgi:acyl-coenzyme A synthetase/AMP-(fatty) acid ligase